MKRIKNILTIIFCLFINMAFSQTQLEEGSVQFSIDMFNKLKTGDKNGNIFFAPISVSTAFTVPYAASTALTKKQIERVFYYDNNAKKNLKQYKDYGKNLERSKDVTISMANGLWIQETMPVKASFLKTVKQLTGRDEIHKVSFTKNHKVCRSQINKWVEDNTEKNIKDLIPKSGLNELTRFVMANAIYFKGNWQSRFDDELTATNSFYGLKKTIPTQFMTKAVTDHNYFENDQMQILELPYKGESTSMVIILPRFKDGLGKIENELSVSTYKKWLKSMTKRPVVVSLPKFNMKIQYDLRSTFRKMGLKEPFTDAATFDNMTPKGGLRLSKVYHQAFIVVSEAGTEAAGATVITGDVKGMKPKPAYFNANQPFLFFIKDTETDMILFMGRLTEPSFSNEVTYSNEQPVRFPPIDNMPDSDVIHFVEKGETLYGISKRYKVTPEQIRRLNNISDNVVKLGQELLIQESEKESTVGTTNTNVNNDTHEVFRGESLFSIARKYNLSVDKLKQLNGLSDNSIKIGQNLVVKEQTQKKPTPKPTFVSTKTYSVKKGDTLWKIAKQHNLSVPQLKKLNNMTTNVVSINQELKIK